MNFSPDASAPLWSGPPQDVLPGATPAAVILGRGPHIVVALNPLRCYPTGVELKIAVRTGLHAADLYVRVLGSDPASGNPAADRLQLSVHLFDGTTLDAGYLSDGEPGPSLTALGSEGSDTYVDVTYWLAPLPPAGPVTVVCAWPEHSILETTTTLDFDEIRSAAKRALPLLTTGP